MAATAKSKAAKSKAEAAPAQAPEGDHLESEHEIQRIIDASEAAGGWEPAQVERCQELAAEAAKGRNRDDLPAHVARFLT